MLVLYRLDLYEPNLVSPSQLLCQAEVSQACLPLDMQLRSCALQCVQAMAPFLGPQTR